MQQGWWGKHRTNDILAHLDGEFGSRSSPKRHGRSASPAVGRAAGPGVGSERQQQRRPAVLPPEQRFLPPSCRKGTDDAARQDLLAHLHEVGCTPGARNGAVMPFATRCQRRQSR